MPQITEVLFLPVCVSGCSLTFVESCIVSTGVGLPRTDSTAGFGSFPIVDVAAAKKPQPAIEVITAKATRFVSA